jgi:hypothetical protein
MTDRRELLMISPVGAATTTTITGDRVQRAAR